MALAVSFPITFKRMIQPFGTEGPSLAMSSNMAFLSLFKSYRPDRDKRSQSLMKLFV
jgi:hypothetical protein